MIGANITKINLTLILIMRLIIDLLSLHLWYFPWRIFLADYFHCHRTLFLSELSAQPNSHQTNTNIQSSPAPTNTSTTREFLSLKYFYIEIFLIYEYWHICVGNLLNMITQAVLRPDLENWRFYPDIRYGSNFQNKTEYWLLHFGNKGMKNIRYSVLIAMHCSSGMRCQRKIGFPDFKSKPIFSNM